MEIFDSTKYFCDPKPDDVLSEGFIALPVD
jgi:hypothetical protein